MAAIDDAVTLGVVENLVNPEYGNDWVKELLEDMGVPTTEENINRVNTGIWAALAALAPDFISQLPDGVRERYTG